jgi:hypothetical protein
MQKNEKIPVPRRIDLSNCELLSTYGRNLVKVPKALAVKVGTIKPR